jgi:hypothetical protein
VNIDDVSVVDAVCGARFAHHPSAQVRLASQVGPNELQRNDAVDEHVSCSINDAHSALTKQRFQSISTGNDLAEKRVLRFFRARSLPNNPHGSPVPSGYSYDKQD